MSDEHSSHDDSSNENGSGAALLGNSLAIVIPILMIVMLAVTGIAFMGNIEKQKSADDSASESVSAAPTAPGGGGGASTPVPSGVDPAQFALGQSSYSMCAACHGMDGKGLKAGPNLMAPSLAQSEIVLGDPERMALVILKGIKKENADYMGVMAPLAAALDDAKLAAVMTYVRNSFGNSAAPVPVETAKKARERFSGLTDPAGVSRTQLDQIMEAHK